MVVLWYILTTHDPRAKVKLSFIDSGWKISDQDTDLTIISHREPQTNHQWSKRYFDWQLHRIFSLEQFSKREGMFFPKERMKVMWRSKEKILLLCPVWQAYSAMLLSRIDLNQGKSSLACSSSQGSLMATIQSDYNMRACQRILGSCLWLPMAVTIL